jgi:predicted ester cyclase
MQTDAAKLRNFAESYATAWCSQDPDRVASFFSAFGSLSVNDGSPAIGRTQIAGVAKSFMLAFPDIKVEMDDLRIEPDNVEFHWTLIGTNTGVGGTGHKVQVSGFEKWRMGADGLIATSQGHFDATEYQRQLRHGI